MNASDDQVKESKHPDCRPVKGCPSFGLLSGTEGQSTLEFAVIAAGFLSIIIAFGALWQAIEGGLFVDHAAASASHHVQEVSPGVVGDVFLY